MASVTQNHGIAPHLLPSIDGNVAVAAPVTKTSQVSKGRDVTTIFNYFKDPADGSPPTPNYANKPSTTVERDARQQVVHDIRGREDEYTLDTTGFQIFKHESVEKDFADEEHIKAIYYPETEELLKKA